MNASTNGTTLEDPTTTKGGGLKRDRSNPEGSEETLPIKTLTGYPVRRLRSIPAPMFTSEGLGGFERARQANRRGNPLDVQSFDLWGRSSDRDAAEQRPLCPVKKSRNFPL